MLLMNLNGYVYLQTAVLSVNSVCIVIVDFILCAINVGQDEQIVNG